MNTVLGIACTSYIALTLLSRSNSTGNDTGVLLSHSSASLLFASTLTPTSVKPSALYRLCIWSSSGISWRHGPHQLAQKLSMTTLPFSWPSDTLSPARDGSEKVGAIDALAPTSEVVASIAATVTPRIHVLSFEAMIRSPLRAGRTRPCASSLRRKSTNRDVLLDY